MLLSLILGYEVFNNVSVDVSVWAVLLALTWDALWGEPSSRWHPVVWMGTLLSQLGRRAPLSGTVYSFKLAFFDGASRWCAGALGVVALAYGLNRCLVMGVADVWAFGGDSSVDWRLDGLQALILSVLLKPMFAWRMLWQEVSHVEQALGQSIAQGRQQLSRLVSRDVSALSEVQIRQAAISTLAENLNDSLVAPLFWFAVAGLPGAALYRFANTADAMWGYWGERGGRDWTWFGRWAAKVDDALSWLPARLSALMLLLVSGCTDWRKVMHAAAQTPSPNGGWPMGALAVAQGICLEKPGVYVLNAQGREPTRQDTEQAVVCCSRVGKMLACLFVLLGVFEWGWS